MCDSCRPTLKDLFEQYPEMIVLVGWDACIIGTASSCGAPTVLVYDAEKIVTGLMEQGMDHSEAVEFFEFNIEGGYYGTHTPKFLYRCAPIKKCTSTQPHPSKSAAKKQRTRK